MVIGIGFAVQLFSGYTYAVPSPNDCPATWSDDEVTALPVLDDDGAAIEYWCVIEGPYTQANEPTYRNIPVGDRRGYAPWYGFVVMAVGGAILVAAVLRDRAAVGGKASPAPDETPAEDEG